MGMPAAGDFAPLLVVLSEQKRRFIDDNLTPKLLEDALEICQHE
jgi:hypothetical protein